MRLLIIEDDEQIADFVSKGLRQAGYAVDHSPDGDEGLALAEREPYDAVILDIMLPGMDGYSVLRRLRQKGIGTPVLVLSARGSLDDKLEGFKAGSDDYLTKPFSFAELKARIMALLKRSSRGSGQSTLTLGNLSMDLLARRVARGGTDIELQPREFALLEYLLRNAGNVVSKTMILEHVWDYHFDPQTNVVDVLVHRLRGKIDRDFAEKMVHTVRGVGYVLKVP